MSESEQSTSAQGSLPESSQAPLPESLQAPVIAMMMAMDKNRLIGQAGGLPWHIPGELAYFKKTTWGKPIIMGRKTYESIGKPLAGRSNIVVTANRSWQADGVIICHDLDSAIAQAIDIASSESNPANELVIIGGAGICKLAMPLTQRLYLTTIDRAFEGDTWLDSFHWDEWQKVSEEVQDETNTGGLPVTYWVLEKRQ
ncbi:MAG: dihydrofolate reductase [Granulosicoccus sp.]|nr:dihydrofolate reductase [Granulosicoccus sp.]